MQKSEEEIQKLEEEKTKNNIISRMEGIPICEHCSEPLQTVEIEKYVTTLFKIDWKRKKFVTYGDPQTGDEITYHCPECGQILDMDELTEIRF